MRMMMSSDGLEQVFSLADAIMSQAYNQFEPGNFYFEVGVSLDGESLWESTLDSASFESGAAMAERFKIGIKSALQGASNGGTLVPKIHLVHGQPPSTTLPGTDKVYLN